MESLRKFYMATSTGGGGNPSDDASKANDRLKDTIDIVAALKDAFTTLGQTIARDITGNIENANDEVQDLGRVLASQIKSGMKNWAKDSADIVNNTEKLAQGTLESKDVQEQLNKAARQYNKTLADITIALNNNVISELEALNYALKIEEAYADQVHSLQLQQLHAMKIEQAMGNLGKIVKGLKNIPLVGELINAEKVLKKMQETAAAGGSKLAVMGAGLKESFASIGKSLTDPTVLIGGLITGLTKLVKLITEYQSKQFEAARDLGVSVERGKQLRDSFVELARTNLQLAVTADDLQKSYAGVQNELGIIVKQSDEFNLSSTLIERRTGATAANMATLQFAAKGMNKSLMEAYRSIVGSAKAEGGRVKVAMSEKQILEGIAQTSGTIYQNFQGNFKAIAAANVQAKALGTTLDKINATQDQFLDFESSIAKEFEAEVLTGKELNLTRARQLALNHDTQGLMVEINKLIGSSAEWNKLDTITQQSKAEALGMSRDAINQMYMDQQKTTLLGAQAGADLQTQYETLVGMKLSRKEIEETLGREAVISAQQASVSEKMAATMDSIKKSIAEAGQVMMPMIEGIANFLADANNLKGVFIGIASVMGAMVGYSLAMRSAGMAQVASQIQVLELIAAQNVQLQMAAVKQGLLAEEAVVTAGASAAAGAGYLGPGALAVGAAVIAGLSAYLATGGMSGGGGGSVPPVVNPTTGIAPINPAIANTSTNTGAAGTAAGGGQPQAITVYTVVDGEVLAKKVVNNIPQVPGKNSN